MSLNWYKTHLFSLPVILINWSVIILTFSRQDVATAAHSFHISNVMQYWCETLVFWGKCVLIYNWGVLELLSIICCSVVLSHSTSGGDIYYFFYYLTFIFVIFSIYYLLFSICCFYYQAATTRSYHKVPKIRRKCKKILQLNYM